MGSLLMERIFWSTPNKFMAAHAEWLLCMQLGHSASPVQYIIRTVDCLVIVAQWQSTVAAQARCPGLIFGDCQLLHFVLKSV